MIQHKSGTFDGFTKKYGIDRLMFTLKLKEKRIVLSQS